MVHALKWLQTAGPSDLIKTVPENHFQGDRALYLAAFERAPDVWSAIRQGDILVHHPYHTFDVVTRLVQEAAADPSVLAIKMTLYRVSPTSPIAQALARAAEMGKEVTVLVELTARFDEERNIRWARALEEAGAHVIYGIRGYKTHAKICLIVRRRADGIHRYLHLGTGNYNEHTARVYTDLDLLTANDEFGRDASQLMNVLTGFSTSSLTHVLDRHGALPACDLAGPTTGLSGTQHDGQVAAAPVREDIDRALEVFQEVSKQ